jgi:hypothetical protein
MDDERVNYLIVGLTGPQARAMRIALAELGRDRRQGARVAHGFLEISRAAAKPLATELELAAQSFEDDDEETAGALYEIVRLLSLETRGQAGMVLMRRYRP